MSLLTISKSALRQLSLIKTQQKKPYLFLGIKSGGCNGFDYHLEATENPPQKLDEIHKEVEVELVVCGQSLLYLLGVEIDYTSDIMGNRFTFTNPNAQSTCGCGSSFSPKE
tara:strand:- start:751 stop:1083 length:333 start_codon:yes stop_codon:yes gene_type:complete